MAYEIPGFSWTLPAAQDLSAFQFCGVNADNTAAGSRAAAPTAGARVIGFCQNKPNAAGIATELFSSGVTKAKVGTGGVTAGDNVKCLANGQVTTVTTGTHIVGTALATGVAGDIVPILLAIAPGNLAP